MASSTGDESIYNLLAAADPKELAKRQQAIHEREQATSQLLQDGLGQLVEENSTFPMTISAITVLGADNTRRSFLKPLLEPLLSVNRDRPYTAAEVLREVGAQGGKLRRFGIYHDSVAVYFDETSTIDSPVADLAVFLTVNEKNRIIARTGTDIGNAEGSAFANVTWLNLFGGAERLDVNASLGTRTRSSYEATLDTPVLSNPELHAQVGGLQSTTQKPFASHEEFLRGAFTKLRWLNNTNGSTHEFAYNAIWRQITGLAEKASPTVRTDAGDSFKSSVSHIWSQDRRDHPTLPTRGYYIRTLSEIAGWGPLKGDVAWWKSEIETQAAIPIPLPNTPSSKTGISFTTGLRAGLLYPLALSSNPTGSSQGSRINDRFQLGGPTDVRGFRLSGLGPHDGPDSVGGDVYLAGSANLLFPLPFPRLGPSSPLRLQTFLTGGRLLALRGEKPGKDMSSDEVKGVVKKTINELGNGLPSMSAGIGLVYALDQARFELNFSLPLVLRRGEEGRKGISFGIGLNFL